MPSFTIDGRKVAVTEGTTVLEGDRKSCVHIPTLCAVAEARRCLRCDVKLES